MTIPEKKLSKLPPLLQLHNWQEATAGQLWADNTDLLIAVPIRNRGESDWRYLVGQAHIVVYGEESDESYATVEGDEIQDWDIDVDDIDLYVKL
ncbi:MAG: hypothetical protein AAFY17_10625 [Cyanobacteria bacterium J06642_11]